jgi:hypothetical protein
MKLPSAEDTKAWQTALAEAAKGKGPLTPAIFDASDGSGHETQIPDLVIAYGRDDNSGASNPNRGATALAVYGDEKEQPQGAVFVDRATNTATVMQFNPQTGSLVSSYTFHDVGGNVAPPPGSGAAGRVGFGPEGSVGGFIDNGTQSAAVEDLTFIPYGVAPNGIPPSGEQIHTPEDALWRVGIPPTDDAIQGVDIADGAGDPTQITGTSLFFSNLGIFQPSTAFQAPSAGIGA